MTATHHEHTTSLSDAQSRLRDLCVPHERTESLSVGECVDRVLAEPVRAVRTVPHYDRAAMDGFAVRSTDTAGASEGSPVQLRLGDRPVAEGEATRVHTGSAFPDDADTVVRIERSEVSDGRVTVYDDPPAGKDVAPAGEDVDAGEHLFDAGRRLRSSDLALLRAAGHRRLDIVERPRVSVIPTGEELVTPGTEPEPGEVVETNGLLVSKLIDQWGGNPTYRDIVGDNTERLRAVLERDTDHDIIVTTGGTSVGKRDRIEDVVTDLGEVLVHGVAIKPGHPVGFGVVDETPVLLLPGYPVSCLVNAVQFLRPAIAWSAGHTPQPHPTVRARTAEPLDSKPGKRSFERVKIDPSPAREAVNGESTGAETGLPGVRSIGKSGASVLSGVTFADGWVEIPESRERVPAGAKVNVQRWE
ncbi:molybdopterin molybdenumtransferase MoeA [Halobacteriales archaeon QS_5_68_33]|nr:MAG: molybdopterin molybdenumtransferase MoeA [Halobacteriales archaeon QS_5_68_33]